MVSCVKPVIYVTLCIICIVYGQTELAYYSIPDVELEALTSGGFRAYIPHVPGITLFAFHANINEEITSTDPGKIYGETRDPENGYWIIKFPNRLSARDKVNYWVFVSHNRLGYRKDGRTWFVQLKDKYTALTDDCSKTSTIVDGSKTTACLDAAVFEDNFNGPTLDNNLWLVEQKIPIYSEPNYEFNSYENRSDTIFFKNGKLFLKPIALMSDHDVRGILDLRNGCTSSIDQQCYHESASSFLLPPVKSAKITMRHSFKYGRIEIRAKLPSGDWIVPVIELEPKDKSEGPNGPKLWIAYSRGNDHFSKSSSEDIGSRVLFSGPVLHPTEPIRSAKLKKLRSDKRYCDDFHTYTFTWKPGHMSFACDSKPYDYINTGFGFSDPSLGVGAHWNVSEAPFNKEYVLSLGVSVGGFNDFPDGYTSPNDPKPWVNGERNYMTKFFDARHVWSKTWNGDDTALQIDYVRITAA